MMILFLGTVSFLTGGLHIVLVVPSGGHSFLYMNIFKYIHACALYTWLLVHKNYQPPHTYIQYTYIIYIDVLYLYSKWHIHFYMFWFYVYVIERSQTPEIKHFHCHWLRVVFSPGPMHCECSVAGISSLAHCKLRCEEHEMCQSVLFLGRQVQGCHGGNLLKHGSADWK